MYTLYSYRGAYAQKAFRVAREGYHMDIILSNSSGVPIYEQIEEQIKSQIMSGDLVEGQLLPSMRVLAKDLKISIITTKESL